MCCLTHEERDNRDRANDVAFVLAENEDFRCRCKFGVPCMRRATEEDLLCDWCRGTDHGHACNEYGLAWKLSKRIQIVGGIVQFVNPPNRNPRTA